VENRRRIISAVAGENKNTGEGRGKRDEERPPKIKAPQIKREKRKDTRPGGRESLIGRD